MPLLQDTVKRGT
jgi:hypothetical protein